MSSLSSKEMNCSRRVRKPRRWARQVTDASSESVHSTDSEEHESRSRGKNVKGIRQSRPSGSKWSNVEYESDEDELDLEYDGPMLLIGFEKVRRNKISMKIEADVLETVLKAAGDLPLSILNIIGPSKLGKSLAINFVVKKLEAMQNGEKNWMGWGKKNSSSTGFSFSHESTAKKGVSIWPQPFLLTTEKGKIAVLVTETNGLHDDAFDSQEALTSIFCLSLLTSSTVIYNTCENQITEDTFMPWIPYIRFGKKIVESIESFQEHPFQALSFLIRDWENPTELCYGAKDGKEFLLSQIQHKLEKQDANYILKAVREYFSTVDTFLLPPAGDFVKSEEFEGHAEQLESEFAKKFEKYVNHLVSPGTLEAKHVYGTKMNALHFKKFLHAYVNLINSYNKGTEKFTGTAIHLVSTKALAECTIEKAITEYRKTLTKERNGACYVEENNLIKLHGAAKNQAEMLLRTSLLHMESTQFNEFRKILASKIREEYEVFKQANGKLRQDIVSEHMAEVIKAYNQRLQSKVNLGIGESFMEDEHIEAASAEALQHTKRRLFESFCTEGEEGRTEISKIFADQTSAIVNNLLKQNAENRHRAGAKISNFVDDCINRYKRDMKELAAETTNDVLSLRHMHKHLKKQSTRDFNAKDFPGTEAFQQKFLSELEHSLDQIFSTYEAEVQKKMDEQNETAESLLKLLKNEYAHELSENASTSMKPDELDELCNETWSELLSKYKRKNPFTKGSSNYQTFELSLQRGLDMAKQTFMHSHVEQTRLLEEKYQRAEDEGVNAYIQDMDNKMKAGCLPETDLNKLHEHVQSKALNIFDEKTECSANARKQRSELESRITEMFANLKISNNESFKMKTEDAEKLLKEAQQQYVTKLETGIYKNRSEIDGAHQKCVDDYTKMLTEKLQGDDELRNSLLSKFGNFVAQKFNAVIGNIEIKMEKERLTMFKLLQEIRQIYHDEMTKQTKGRVFSTIGALETLHRKVTVNAISQCARISKITLSSEQRQRLVRAMEDSFCKYKLDYTMSKSNQTENPAIGIDLGTTYCCVAVIGKDQKLKIITSHEGDQTTPSYVAFHEDGSQVIGQTAKDTAYMHPENTVFDAKRMIGRRIGDPKLQDDMKYWPFTVIEHNGVPKIDIRGQPYPPERVSAILLSKLKAEAEQKLGGIEIKKAVITVPAYFDDGQRAATVDAGEMAGFEVLTILNEPTAAAIAYKMEQFSDIPKKVLVYDLGGGTFDVAVLQTAAKSIDVLGVDGDTHLGGEDFDKNLMQECVRQFKEQTRIDLLKDKDSPVKQKKEECRRILRRLQTYSEKAKRQLSTALQATIAVDGIVPNKDLHVVITRAQFEELNRDLFQKTMDVVDKALRDAKITKDQIDDILLVGGSTKIPKIRDMLTKHFNNKSLSHSVHPDVAVAYGAAVQAALLNGAKGETLFDFESIRDVTPMALGVEARIRNVHGRFSTIIPKNTKIPHDAVETYYTTYKNQRSVEINVYQGEDRVAKNNNFLGTFDLDGIPPNEAGKESLDVKMEIDKMGILHVTAVCNSNSSSNSITVQAKKGRLTEAEKKEIRTAIQAQAKRQDKEGSHEADNDSSTSNYEDWYTGTGQSTSGGNFDLSDEDEI